MAQLRHSRHSELQAAVQTNQPFFDLVGRALGVSTETGLDIESSPVYAFFVTVSQVDDGRTLWTSFIVTAGRLLMVELIDTDMSMITIIPATRITRIADARTGPERVITVEFDADHIFTATETTYFEMDEGSSPVQVPADAEGTPIGRPAGRETSTSTSRFATYVLRQSTPSDSVLLDNFTRELSREISGRS